MPFRRSGFFGYDRQATYQTTEDTLATVLKPGFFKPKTLNPKDTVFVFASDGAAQVYVSGELPTGEPILSFFVNDLAESSAPRRGRPPKVAEVA